MNSFLLSLAALLILVLSALFAAPLFIDWNNYRPIFETQATRLFGREVKVGGNVHLVLLPTPELRFDDVKVADAAGNLTHPFLEARSLQALLNIGALLSGTIEARQITIADPILRLELNADGTGNWSDVGRPGQALPFVPKEVQLDAVNVTGGRIELARSGKELLTLDRVEGEASAASLNGPYKVSATYDFEDRHQTIRFSTGAPEPDGDFRLKAELHDPDRSSIYLLDGDVAGLGGKPAYHGGVILRTALSSASTANSPQAAPAPQPMGDATAPAQTSQPADLQAMNSGIELKGDLDATPERVELPSFDLTLYAKAHPQILKGKLAIDLGERHHTEAALSAHFLDIDALLAAAGHPAASPAALFGAIAGSTLGAAASFGEGSIALTVEQLSLGGDLVGNLDLALASGPDGVKLTRLEADLPGANHLEASGSLTTSSSGAAFAGPIKLQGSGLRTLTRWLAGGGNVSAQGSMGDFTLAADATIGPDHIKLDHATGVMNDTKFSGALDYRGGAEPAIEVSLDSDRLDLHAILGDDASWRSLLPGSATSDTDAATPGPSLLSGLRDDQLKVSLRIGELLLPGLPSGKLDADFTLAKDVLDIGKLDFAASDSVTLSGKGHIDNVSAAPSGKADFSLQAANAEALKTAAALLGFPDAVSRSPSLAGLAPLDMHVSVDAAPQAGGSKITLELGGDAGGGDVALQASATGDPAKLDMASIDVDGSMSGGRPQALLALLAPELPEASLDALGTDQAKLTLKLAGVPRNGVSGRIGLETASIRLGFDGRGSLKQDGTTLTGTGSVATPNAGLALALLGLSPSPAASSTAVDLRADLVKAGSVLELKSISGQIGGEPVQATARLDWSGQPVHFGLNAGANAISLPALLGPLVAWQRTPSTDEMLGSINGSASDVWPARGFALGALSHVEGDLKLNAKTLTLGVPFKLDNAELSAKIDNGSLSVTDLKGRLFGGTFTASGSLSPRGTGAELKASAKLDAGQLDLLSKTLLGSALAKGPFTLNVDVSGEGLSPPGLVAGLSGDGVLSLEPGTLQALSPDPLRRFGAEAAKTKKLKDKDQITALTNALRDQLTKGSYRYAATSLPFEIKNGTLRLKGATLASKGADTAINGYLELTSLRLDSEWHMQLDGSDLPPVSLVFAGPLANAGQITPAIDTDAVESYLTVRRMQEDVERLENLDVSGRNPPPPDDGKSSAASPAPTTNGAAATGQATGKPSADAKPQTLPGKPATRLKSQADAKPQASAKQVPASATGVAPVTNPPRAADLDADKNAPAATGQAASTPDQAAPATPSTATQAQPDGAAPATGSTADDAAATPASTDPSAAAPPKPKPRRPQPAPDDWKKGISIFGGG